MGWNYSWSAIYLLSRLFCEHLLWSKRDILWLEMSKTAVRGYKGFTPGRMGSQNLTHRFLYNIASQIKSSDIWHVANDDRLLQKYMSVERFIPTRELENERSPPPYSVYCRWIVWMGTPFPLGSISVKSWKRNIFFYFFLFFLLYGISELTSIPHTLRYCTAFKLWSISISCTLWGMDRRVELGNAVLG